MDRLTKQQIEDWRGWAKDGHTMEFGKILNAKFISLCDLALQSLSRGAVRDEALEEALRSSPCGRLLLQGYGCNSHVLTNCEPCDCWRAALKREPNAAGQDNTGLEDRPRGTERLPNTSGPAPAAPDVASMVKRLREDAEWNWISEDNARFSAELINNLQHTATLEREAAALLAKLGQGWIPVSERLPEKGHDARCLCWIIKRHGTGDFGWIGLRAFHHERHCWLNNAVENIESDGECVTHWMPLPPTPGASDD